MSFSNNINDINKVFTKTDLFDLIKEELTYLGLKSFNSVLAFDDFSKHYTTFRYCPRTDRLQYRNEGEYNFRLVQNATRDDLCVLAVKVSSTLKN